MPVWIDLSVNAQLDRPNIPRVGFAFYLCLFFFLILKYTECRKKIFLMQKIVAKKFLDQSIVMQNFWSKVLRFQKLKPLKPFGNVSETLKCPRTWNRFAGTFQRGFFETFKNWGTNRVLKTCIERIQTFFKNQKNQKAPPPQKKIGSLKKFNPSETTLKLKPESTEAF